MVFIQMKNFFFFFFYTLWKTRGGGKVVFSDFKFRRGVQKIPIDAKKRRSGKKNTPLMETFSNPPSFSRRLTFVAVFLRILNNPV